jgi:hypothetical protein
MTMGDIVGVDSNGPYSRSALETRAREMEDNLGEALAAFIIALGEYAARAGNVEHANGLLRRTVRNVVWTANNYGKITVGEEDLTNSPA